MPSSKLRLGIDLDGVCADFTGRWRQIAQDMFGEPITGPQTTWDFGCWLPQDKMDMVYRAIDRTKNFWETLGKMKGTELLTERQHDFELWFITSRMTTAGRTTHEQSCRWLRNNYEIEFPQVICTRGSKAPFAKALELFAYIDDNTGHCTEVSQVPTCRRTTYLKHADYNADFGNALHGIIRVPDLNNFLEAQP